MEDTVTVMAGGTLTAGHIMAMTTATNTTEAAGVAMATITIITTMTDARLKEKSRGQLSAVLGKKASRARIVTGKEEETLPQFQSTRLFPLG